MAPDVPRSGGNTGKSKAKRVEALSHGQAKRPKGRRIVMNVINHYGDEVLKVYSV